MMRYQSSVVQRENAPLRHRQKMEKRKAAQEAEVASKTITQKGHTGKGKGKSTAAFGLLPRARSAMSGLATSCNSSWVPGTPANAGRSRSGLVVSVTRTQPWHRRTWRRKLDASQKPRMPPRRHASVAPKHQVK